MALFLLLTLLCLDNHKLDQVSKFPYLGSIYQMERTQIKRCIGIAKPTFSKNFKLFTFKKLNLNIKKNLFRIYVWSITLYGCETWVINETERKVLEAFEM